MKRWICIFVIMITMFISFGCGGTFNIGPSPTQTFEQIKDMNHQDRAILAIATYNAEWESYQNLKDAYNLAYPRGIPSEAQEDLDGRANVLRKVYPIITRYDNFAQNGGVIQPEDINEILLFLRIYYLKKQGGN